MFQLLRVVSNDNDNDDDDDDDDDGDDDDDDDDDNNNNNNKLYLFGRDTRHELFYLTTDVSGLPA